MPGQYTLFESASGYALFEVVEVEEVVEVSCVELANGEVDLEGDVEGGVVLGGLHQGGRQRCLERRAIFEGDLMDGLGRIEVLGERHRQPSGPELHHETREQVEHG